MRTLIRIKPLIAAALAILASLALLGGCGGDDGSGEASGASDGADASLSSKEEFVKEANAACEEIRNRLSAQVQNAIYEGESKKTPQQIGNEIVIPAFEEQARELSSLQPPAGDTKQIENVTDAIEEVANTIRTNLKAYLSGPGGRLFKPSEKAADGYGLTSCGRP